MEIQRHEESDLMDLADSLGNRFKEKRESKGIKYSELGFYLFKRWGGKNQINATNYVRDVEVSIFNLISNVSHYPKSKLRLHETRIPDYAAALDFNLEETEEIKVDIKRIRGDFDFRGSSVKPYRKG